MICVTANKYLMCEYKAGRMSAESVARVRAQWTNKNRPQVIEFQYDQATQRDLILYNLSTFRFHGECAESPLVLNATMYGWRTMAKEMSVRTFCAPDSVIRKHMHDAHKILEMLGAPLVTFLAFQDLQLKTLAKINEEQKKKVERRKVSGAGKETVVCGPQPKSPAVTPRTRKGSREEKMSFKKEDQYEGSRGGRLGMMMRDASG